MQTASQELITRAQRCEKRAAENMDQARRLTSIAEFEIAKAQQLRDSAAYLDVKARSADPQPRGAFFIFDAGPGGPSQDEVIAVACAALGGFLGG